MNKKNIQRAKFLFHVLLLVFMFLINHEQNPTKVCLPKRNPTHNSKPNLTQIKYRAFSQQTSCRAQAELVILSVTSFLLVVLQPGFWLCMLAHWQT